MIVNVLSLHGECPACHQMADFTLQFRYGDVWLRKYRLGERIFFSGKGDIGVPGHRKVVLRGLVNWCSNCSLDGDYDENYIFVEHDKICSYAPATGIYEFNSGEDFIVLDD